MIFLQHKLKEFRYKYTVEKKEKRRIMKKIFLFSGQGSQYSGMGKELLSLCPKAKEIYECGSDVLGFDLKESCFEGSDADLAQTKTSQPAIFATSLVALEAVKDEGVTADAVAGHSLGEYAAMVACGILSIQDGFKVIKARAAAMQKCAESQSGAMCAVLGTDSETVERICEQAEGYVVPVNYNCPGQTVIAGESAAIDKAIELFSQNGAKCIRLNVNAAFHSKLMQPAADELFEAVKEIEFQKPVIDFYSNVTGKKLTDFSDMPSYLRSHLVSPVKFVDELNAIKGDGFDTFVELGPNKVLTGLVKKTFKDVTALNVENQKTFEKALPLLGV
jgi:[acyl-carrier-protein] S-malonyltransferase